MTVMTNSAKNNGNPFGAVDYAMHKEDILATGITVKEYEGEVAAVCDPESESLPTIFVLIQKRRAAGAGCSEI